MESHQTQNVQQEDASNFKGCDNRDISEDRGKKEDFENREYPQSPGEHLKIFRMNMNFISSMGTYAEFFGSGSLFSVVQTKGSPVGIILSTAHNFLDPFGRFSDGTIEFVDQQGTIHEYPIGKVIMLVEYRPLYLNKAAKRFEYDYAFVIVDFHLGRTISDRYFAQSYFKNGGWNDVHAVNVQQNQEILAKVQESLYIVSSYQLDTENSQSENEPIAKPGNSIYCGEAVDSSIIYSELPQDLDRGKLIAYNVPTFRGHSGSIVGFLKEKSFIPVAIHCSHHRNYINKGRVIDSEILNFGVKIKRQIEKMGFQTVIPGPIEEWSSQEEKTKLDFEKLKESGHDQAKEWEGKSLTSQSQWSSVTPVQNQSEVIRGKKHHVNSSCLGVCIKGQKRVKEQKRTTN